MKSLADNIVLDVKTIDMKALSLPVIGKGLEPLVMNKLGLCL